MDLKGLVQCAQEWKVIGIMGRIVLWVSSTWIRQLDTVLIAVAGAIVMFLPGMNLFGSWKEAEQGIRWNSVVMIGVTSLGAFLQKQACEMACRFFSWWHAALESAVGYRRCKRFHGRYAPGGAD
jgi:hypothetical protein